MDLCVCIYTHRRTHAHTQLIVHLREHTKISHRGIKWQPVAPTCLTNAAAFKLFVMLKRTRFMPVGLCRAHHRLVLRISRKPGINCIVVVQLCPIGTKRKSKCPYSLHAIYAAEITCVEGFAFTVVNGRRPECPKLCEDPFMQPTFEKHHNPNGLPKRLTSSRRAPK